MNKDEATKSSAVVHVDRVGVRVPPFYPEKPALWFAQLESQFALANITADSTKFHYAMGQLEPVYAAKVEDIIIDNDTVDKYQRLKTELVKRLSASRERKVQQLLTHEELGDRKPSQFLRHLKNLAGPGVPDEFLRSLWTHRLPSSTQSIIALQAKASLEEVAELADRIHDVVTTAPQLAVVQAAPAIATEAERQIAELTRQVAALTAKLDRMAWSRSRSTSRNRHWAHSRSPSATRKHPNCWYHYKFGDNARKCVKPCTYSGNVEGSQ